ncbi:unnamed protein product [Discula destructiva]
MSSASKPEILQHTAAAASASFSKGTKRRRNAPSGDGFAGLPPPKKPKTGPSSALLQVPDAVKHDLLAQYYPTTLTLRQYVLDTLPPSSRLRRRKIAAVGSEPSTDQDPGGIRAQLARLLDTTVVGLHVPPKELAKAQAESRLQHWFDYSQRDDSRVTLSGGDDASAVHFQSEIVDFVIWLLFSREKEPSKRPQHLLCDGFRKGTSHQAGWNSVQGLYSLYFNERVAHIKQAPWPQLLHLLGQSGESMMINLLLDGSIFLRIEAGRGNYYQLSGPPIFECEPFAIPSAPSPVMRPVAFDRKPTDIVFVRSRMLYARAALNARGSVHFGLRHIHALNRFPVRDGNESRNSSVAGHSLGNAPSNPDNSLRIMMYMFPRQFGLHNVFTSHVDHTKTAQKFQDYTLREEEIFAKFRRTGAEDCQQLDARIPKRLRGRAEHLAQRMQTLHARCSYAKLLEHHCPVERHASEETAESHISSAKSAPLGNKLSGKSSRGRRKSRHSTHAAQIQAASYSYTSLTGLAVPIAKVSAFCQAIFLKIIPHEFWGLGDVQEHNRANFLRSIDRFLKLRRFETTSLHEVMQGLKIAEIDWLEPPGLKGLKCSQTDLRKRKEIFSEFVYYAFDSLLIPLIRSNFYVTESNVHRYRVFFFRHDVWRSVAEPAMAELKVKMFEEVKMDDALRILDSRRLGYSQVRLLPKQSSVRPIMNLRRRMVTSKDKKVLGYSINSILDPVSNMLKLEKSAHAGRLASAMFSVGDLYERLSGFKQRLGPGHGPLYFAKVDVQAAFDTIPQDAIIALMRSVPSHPAYDMIKHVEVAPNDSSTVANYKTLKRWHTSARAAGNKVPFLENLAQQLAPGKKNTVYVDSVFRRSHRTCELLALMASHIQQNLVKIGKKYYRQKAGIPQGSVISSVLCNYFYADLEQTQLYFLRGNDCLLLRLIDDFLLITTDQGKAARFVKVMQKGMPEYGVTVSPPKTLVNFPLTINNLHVPSLPSDRTWFPYCGTRISTLTLDLTKDRGLAVPSVLKDPTISNALTVEFTRHPGVAFKRKTLNAFKIQSHIMFFDAGHNAGPTVLRNLRDALVETATKAWAYARCLAAAKRPGAKVWVDTIGDLVDVAYLLLNSKARKARYPRYECRVTKGQVRWLVLAAFRGVLGRKQALFGEVLAWLDQEMGKLEARVSKAVGGRDAKLLVQG